jgi:uncharacterized protein YlaI
MLLKPGETVVPPLFSSVRFQILITNMKMAIFCLHHMETVSFSETSANIYQTAWCYMAKDSYLHVQLCWHSQPAKPFLCKQCSNRLFVRDQISNVQINSGTFTYNSNLISRNDYLKRDQIFSSVWTLVFQYPFKLPLLRPSVTCPSVYNSSSLVPCSHLSVLLQLVCDWFKAKHDKDAQ